MHNPLAPAIRRNGFSFDNRWVVPYNPYLLLKYDCHINVEICTSVKSIKYLYKYVYKGHDRAEVQVVPAAEAAAAAGGAAADGGGAAAAPVGRDEVQEYIDGRYVSAAEAAWRLLNFEMSAIFPPVVRLQVHPPDQQPVYFRETDTLADVANRPATSQLLKYFAFNKAIADEYAAALAVDPAALLPVALSTCYQDAPKIATWDAAKKRWALRRNNRTRPVGRLYNVMPSAGERYYVRLLLHNVCGPTCWEDLRSTGEGDAKVVHPTFMAACLARGLLQDDAEWTRCMEEARLAATPHQTRCAGATIGCTSLHRCR
jgi:hypothetical protein